MAKLRKALENGGKAKVKSGPFAGFEVAVISLKANTAKATVNLFGSDVPADFPLEMLEAV
jgi:transcription antitermination factor NusG